MAVDRTAGGVWVQNVNDSDRAQVMRHALLLERQAEILLDQARSLRETLQSQESRVDGRAEAVAAGTPAVTTYTISEVAKILHMGESTVRKLISTGDLAKVTIGHSVRVREQDLVSLIERSTS